MPRRVLPLMPPGHTLQSAAVAFLDRLDLTLASRPISPRLGGRRRGGWNALLRAVATVAD
jgi:hypothetical protein